MFKRIAISTFTLLNLFSMPLTASPIEPKMDNNISRAAYSGSDLPEVSNYGEYPRNRENITFSQDISWQLIGARIIATFAPQDSQGQPIELNELASRLGYDHFNWVSYVEHDPYGISDRTGKVLSTPYNDPPQGGYQYDTADELPFYWDLVECDRCNQRYHYQNPNITRQFELVFEDAPSDYRLQPGEAIEFITHLVGVKSYDTQTKTTQWDIINTFRWKLTNPVSRVGQVSLVEANVNLTKLSPFLLIEMQADGAILPKEVGEAHRPSFPDNKKDSLAATVREL